MLKKATTHVTRVRTLDQLHRGDEPADAPPEEPTVALAEAIRDESAPPGE